MEIFLFSIYKVYIEFIFKNSEKNWYLINMLFYTKVTMSLNGFIANIKTKHYKEY